MKEQRLKEMVDELIKEKSEIITRETKTKRESDIALANYRRIDMAIRKLKEVIESDGKKQNTESIEK